MSASFLNFLRAGPPPPKVVLLPDALFFSRTLPISPEATAADVAAQVELALESISPFPIAQLYHGYFHATGSAHALVFATYRRRFSSEQISAWSDAEIVLPAFATVLGGEMPSGTTLIMTNPEGLTAVHVMGGGAIQIFTEPLSPDATDEDRSRVRERLIRATGGSTSVIDLPASPTAEPVENDGEIIFRAGPFLSRFPAATAAALDVRDKEQLAVRRRAHARDVLFWRVALGCVAALGILALGELSLMAGRTFWQKNRVALVQAQKPVVDSIIASQARAIRIEDLSTKRLLPLEMISIVAAKKPSSVLFISARTDVSDRDRLIIEARADNSAEMNLFESALKAAPEYNQVDFTGQRGGGASTTFTITVSFKPDVVKPFPLP